MKPDFYQLMKEHNVHHMFLNESGIINALEKSYNQGTSDLLNWLSEQSHLCNNINYIIEEWKNQHG